MPPDAKRSGPRAAEPGNRRQNITTATAKQQGPSGASVRRGSRNQQQAPVAPASGLAGRRREHLLKRLREADGPQYDTLCAEVAEAFPAGTRWWAGAQAVRAVRDLLWDELATVDSDGGIWLLPAGWQAAA